MQASDLDKLLGRIVNHPRFKGLYGGLTPTAKFQISVLNGVDGSEQTISGAYEDVIEICGRMLFPEFFNAQYSLGGETLVALRHAILMCTDRNDRFGVTGYLEMADRLERFEGTEEDMRRAAMFFDRSGDTAFAAFIREQMKREKEAKTE